MPHPVCCHPHQRSAQHARVDRQVCETTISEFSGRDVNRALVAISSCGPPPKFDMASASAETSQSAGACDTKRRAISCEPCEGTRGEGQPTETSICSAIRALPGVADLTGSASAIAQQDRSSFRAAPSPALPGQPPRAGWRGAMSVRAAEINISAQASGSNAGRLAPHPRFRPQKCNRSSPHAPQPASRAAARQSPLATARAAAGSFIRRRTR